MANILNTQNSADKVRENVDLCRVKIEKYINRRNELSEYMLKCDKNSTEYAFYKNEFRLTVIMIGDLREIRSQYIATLEKYTEKLKLIKKEITTLDNRHAVDLS